MKAFETNRNARAVTDCVDIVIVVITDEHVHATNEHTVVLLSFTCHPQAAAERKAQAERAAAELKEKAELEKAERKAALAAKRAVKEKAAAEKVCACCACDSILYDARCHDFFGLLLTLSRSLQACR